MKIALAIFVKTPGLSGIKTRLAASIGTSLAEEFYFQSLKAIESVVTGLHKTSLEFEPIWAVAEKGASEHPLWQKFHKVYQGEGELGQRLACVHDQLFENFDVVYFMGADSPHLSANFLLHCVNNFCHKSSASFQIGEAEDGGFYLLGMKKKISLSIWSSITYSAHSTANELREKIISLGEIEHIEKNFDVDTIDDLVKYKNEYWSIVDATREQNELIQWVRKNF